MESLALIKCNNCAAPLTGLGDVINHVCPGLQPMNANMKDRLWIEARFMLLENMTKKIADELDAIKKAIKK